MATILKLMSGNFRVQIRRRGQYASKTFLRRADAQSWALEAERRADCGEPINPPINNKTYRFRDLIDYHIADMKEVRKPLRRSKAYSLILLGKQFGTFYSVGIKYIKEAKDNTDEVKYTQFFHRGLLHE